MRKVPISFSYHRLATVAAVLALLPMSLSLMHPTPAAAATGCTDGDRSFANSLASSGNFVETGSVWLDGGFGKITLRYSSDSGCAWGLVSNLPPASWGGIIQGKVWLDRSGDGGATWQPWLGSRATGIGQNSTYTGTYNTIGFNAIRACGQSQDNLAPALDPRNGLPDFGPVACTSWFFPGRLYPNESMGGRGFDSLSSPNNRYVLRMQSDGNFVLYSWGRPIWASNTNSGPGTIARMQSDGNLVVIAPGNRPVWASGTNHPGDVLMVQNDGNLVIYAPGNVAVWASNTAGR